MIRGAIPFLTGQPMLRPLATSLAVLAAAPAAAQAVFTPPAGCTGVLTAQLQGCLMTHVWTCEGDAEGHQWVALFDEIGPRQIRLVDRDFQWLQTFYFDPPAVETLESTSDALNLDTLFRYKFDDFDFVTRTDTLSEPERFRGYDRLTGETVVIDGEPLWRTEFAYDVLDPDDTVYYSAGGRQYVSERHRIFFFGEAWDAATPDVITDNSPVSFAYPGEPGFFSQRPTEGCGALMSGVPQSQGASE